MSRYDYQGTLDYAQKKIDEARVSREKTAKDQEKFSKRLLGINTLVKGANYLVNQRADALESSFGPAKAKYKSYIQNAEATTTYWNDIQKNGGVDYLQKQIYDSYLASAKEVKPFDEVKNISGWIYDEATTKANELYSALEQKATQAKDVPTMKDFMDDYENFTEIQAPRTLFGAATNALEFIRSAYINGLTKNAHSSCGISLDIKVPRAVSTSALDNELSEARVWVVPKVLRSASTLVSTALANAYAILWAYLSNNCSFDCIIAISSNNLAAYLCWSIAKSISVSKLAVKSTEVFALLSAVATSCIVGMCKTSPLPWTKLE